MKSYLRMANLLLLPLFCLAMSPSNSRAELAQSYYATLQYVAPEALTIRVTKTLVSRTGDGKNAICKVCVEAIVEGISLSTSMLQIGNRIVIEYETVERRDPIPDAKPIPVLQVYEICPAFLVGQRHIRS